MSTPSYALYLAGFFSADLTVEEPDPSADTSTDATPRATEVQPMLLTFTQGASGEVQFVLHQPGSTAVLDLTDATTTAYFVNLLPTPTVVLEKACTLVGDPDEGTVKLTLAATDLDFYGRGQLEVVTEYVSGSIKKFYPRVQYQVLESIV
jgi:hypothetical protein